MKRLVIAGLALFIFCITSSLAIGEDLVASLPQADTVKQVDTVKQADTNKSISNLPEGYASTFIKEYEKNYKGASKVDDGICKKNSKSCIGTKWPVCCQLSGSPAGEPFCAANAGCKKP